MRTGAVLLSLGLVVSAAHGQYVEATIALPDSVGGLNSISALLYHSPTKTIYVGGSDSFLIAVDARTNEKLINIPVGIGPHVVCSDPVGNKVYCANYDATVTVVDAATNQPLKTLPLGRRLTDLVYNGVENKLYCGNSEDSLVRVIDCAGDSVLAPIAVSSGPSVLCFSRQLNRVYCVHASRDEVSVIDCAADTSLGCIWVRGVEPRDICYDSATNCVYTANNVSNSIAVIDCAGDTLARLVPAGRSPSVLVVGPPGKVYCANSGDSSVSAISGSGVNTIGAVRQPKALNYDPVNDKVYCAGFYSDSVTVIDAAGDTVLAQVRTDQVYYAGTEALCYNPAGNNTCVACGRDDVVDAIGGVSDSVEVVLTFWSCSPGPLCYNAANNHLYCLDRGSNLLFIIDEDSNLILKTLKTGRGSDALIWSPANNKVYFANTSDSTVSIVDCIRDSIVATVVTGYQPTVLCCSDDGSVFVGNDQGGVAVIDGAGDSVRAVIPAGYYVRTLGYSRTDNKVYFGTYYGDTVGVIDAGGDSVVASILLSATHVGAMCWNQYHDKLYVCSSDRDSVAVIDCRSDTVLRNIGVAAGLERMYSDSDCDKVYCADWGGWLHVISAEDDSCYKSVSVAADAAVLMDNGKPGPANRLYCTDDWTDQVTVVQAYKTDTVLRSIQVGYSPNALAWNPTCSRMYVSNYWSSSISVIRDTLGPGVEEAMSDERGTMNAGPTVIRGVLVLPRDGLGTRSGLSDNPVMSRAALLDVAGRKVLDLRPGANDVSRLSPGVYFVREVGVSREQGVAGIRKCVLVR